MIAFRWRCFNILKAILVIWLSFGALLFLNGCSEEIVQQQNQHRIQDGWAQRLSSQEYSFTLPDLEDWTLVQETYRDGVVSLYLTQQVDDQTISLVATILPIVLYNDELVYEAQRMLESSLYRIQTLEEAEPIYISGVETILIDTVAGDKETIYVRTAGFTTGGRSYFFTILAGDQEIFEENTEKLELIIASINGN